MTNLEKNFNTLNDIYYELYEAHLNDEITIFQWEKVKESIWELKDALKNAEKTKSKQNK